MKPLKRFLLSLIIMVVIIPFGAVSRAEENDNPDHTLSPYFFVKSDDASIDQLPLKATTAEVNIAGVIADVLDDQDPETVLASKVRMIFVKETGPWTLIKGAAADSEFDALGIPRVNLNAISTFLKAAGSAASTRKLPYEMIVVGLKAAE